ncbi:pentapeptide repeat-containing protein [Nostoc sphaeroides]|nr:pentapeptide repeat-containing protein [Nostoc sphaeroides]
MIVAFVAIAILYQFEWSGFGKDENKSETTKVLLNPRTGEKTEFTEKTTSYQSAKTLWDWLGLAGTIAIPFALFYFERSEQRRSEKRSQELEEQTKREKEIAEEQTKREKEIAEELTKHEKKIADNNLNEQVLETYIDKMSELLIDKNLKALIDKELNAAVDIARARTLSVLRRLAQDTERLNSVFEFLSDAELIEYPILRGANFKGVNLSSVNICNANLTRANLIDAILILADLTRANLIDADLTNTNLTYAELGCADLTNANLTRANLTNADLTLANLKNARLIDANFEGAYLIGADLTGADFKGANLKDATLSINNLPDVSTPPDMTVSGKFGRAIGRAIANSIGVDDTALTALIGINKSANLLGANPSGANLSGAKNLTPDQVKKAKNWELAKYDEKFRVKLGLPPDYTSSRL